MVLSWVEVHKMVMSRLAKRQMETMTPEERVARAKKAVAARKWRPKKTPMNEGKSPQKTDKDIQ